MMTRQTYSSPRVEWTEDIRLEKAFLQDSVVSGSASSSGIGHTGVTKFENDDWGGND